MTRRGGWRVGRVRWLMEVSAVALGILLGGRFGVGTLVFAMLVGFSVDACFRVFGVRAHRREPAVELVPPSRHWTARLARCHTMRHAGAVGCGD